MTDSPGTPDPSSKDGNYVVVARRYRPRGFDELVGQEHVGRALKNAIETSRVGHAYLFTGARGVGKTSTARIFAKALNDPGGPTADPDGSSDVAQAIDAGEDVDVIEIDGASNRGIDEIRSLRANVGVRPSRSRFKIYIIDEVHMLTAPAFNALLKTLEEPPEHVKFIFCTTDPEKIPITVLSRCQRFDFAPVEVTKIVGRLREIVTAESAEAEDAALELIARRAAGSMRDSQSLLEQVLSFSDGKLTSDQVHQMLGTADDERLHALAKSMAGRDASAAMKQLDAAIDAGVDAGRLAEQLLGYFRDLMAVTVGCDASMQRHTSASLAEELKTLGDQWGLQTVLAVVGLVDQTLVRIRHSVYGRVLLEATLIQICNLPDLQNIADLAAAAGSAASGEKKNRVAPKPASESGSTAPTQSAPVISAPTSPVSSASVPAHPQPSAGAASSAPATSGSTHPPSQSTPQPAATQSAPVATQSASVATLAPPSSGRSIDRWDPPTVQKVWKSAISQLEAITESLALSVESVVPVGSDKLKLVFPAESKLAMSRCDLPEHRTAIANSVSQVAGRAITLELDMAAPKAKAVAKEPTAQRPSRMQRMREIESNPAVRSCIEIFEAEIVRIDKPR